ncbi:MAG: MBL fold metallo-hydrolase [Oscillospiraceae bacterium]|nr:MBL fold metallo-hydrolase [Oscillospiraceae bacterium]
MHNWFTVEQIDPETFAISEYKHWEETHCYLLCGQEKALLIDTGLGVSDIRTVVDGLTRLPVTVLTTHVHWDHIGGHGRFDRVAVHEAERNWLSEGFPLPAQEVKNQLTKAPCDFPEEFVLESYQVFQGEPQILFGGGDRFDLGGRGVCVLHTPGHSPGHCCFYEPERRYLYSGDLIYQGCLYAFYPTTDPQLFYRSVKRLRGYDIDRIFPGHHNLNIAPSLVEEIEAGFARIDGAGLLRQGNGLFDFGSFQIQI